MVHAMVRLNQMMVVGDAVHVRLVVPIIATEVVTIHATIPVEVRAQVVKDVMVAVVVVTVHVTRCVVRLVRQAAVGNPLESHNLKSYSHATLESCIVLALTC